VHRTATEHDQIRALLPRFFGDGGDNLAESDPQRRIQTGGFETRFNPSAGLHL